MKGDKRAKARQLRGNLEALREHTRGGDTEIVALMHKLDLGELAWTGRSPVMRRKHKGRCLCTHAGGSHLEDGRCEYTRCECRKFRVKKPA